MKRDLPTGRSLAGLTRQRQCNLRIAPGDLLAIRNPTPGEHAAAPRFA